MLQTYKYSKYKDANFYQERVISTLRFLAFFFSTKNTRGKSNQFIFSKAAAAETKSSAVAGLCICSHKQISGVKWLEEQVITLQIVN